MEATQRHFQLNAHKFFPARPALATSMQLGGKGASTTPKTITALKILFTCFQQAATG